MSNQQVSAGDHLQENPQEAEFVQHVTKIMSSFHDIEEMPESASPEEILCSFLHCLNSFQGPMKCCFEKLDNMFTQDMPEERRQMLAEISNDFWEVLVTTLDFTPSARKFVHDKKLAAEFLRAVHDGLQGVADVSDESKIPDQLVRMNYDAMQLLQNLQTSVSAKDLLPHADQLSRRYKDLIGKIQIEMEVVSTLLADAKLKTEQRRKFTHFMTGLSIALAVVTVFAFVYCSSSAVAASSAYADFEKAKAAAQFWQRSLRGAKAAVQSTNSFWARASGKTAALAKAAEASGKAAAEAKAAWDKFAAVGGTTVFSFSVTAACGLGKVYTCEKEKEHKATLANLAQTQGSCEALLKRMQELKSGSEGATNTLILVKSFLKLSDDTIEQLHPRSNYWWLLKSPETGDLSKKLFESLKDLMDQIDELEKHTIRSFASWMRTPGANEVPASLLKEVVQETNMQDGAFPPRKRLRALQIASTVTVAARARSEDDPEVHEGWRSMVIGAFPQKLHPPTKPGGVDLAPLSNETYCGVYLAYFDNEVSSIVFLLITKSTAAMASAMPTHGIYKTQHLVLTECKLQALRRENKLGPEGKFLYVLGFAIDGKKLKDTSCANVTMNKGERHLTQSQFDSIFEYLTTEGYDLKR